MDRETTPLVPLAAPGREAVGGDTKVVIPPVTQTPIMVGVALDRPSQLTAYPLGVGLGALEMEVVDRVTKGLVQGGRAQPIVRTKLPTMLQVSGLGPHGQGCPTPALALNQPRGI